MATINLGQIKFNWRGAYSGATAYVVDDVVESGGNSYVCILASTGNTPPNATYWELMASKGTDTSVLTTQGDVLYHDGSSLARLGAGTSGQLLQSGGTGANPSWTNAPSGVVKQIIQSQDSTQRSTVSTSFTTAGNTLDLTITPTSTSSKMLVSFDFSGGGSTASTRYFYTIERFTGGTGTDLGSGVTGVRTHEIGGSGTSIENPMTINIVDSPNTTSSITYYIKIKVQGGTGYINTNGIAQSTVIEYIN
jgi:hypothetical protein